MNPRTRNKYDTFFDFFDKYPREYFVIAFFFIFLLSIIWETFSYTVLNYDFYEELAYAQQVGEIELPVTRGTVYSAANSINENGTVLSTSVDLNDLAIDPQIVGDRQKLGVFLTNILYKEMCYLKTRDDCYDDMLRFLRLLEIPDFKMEEGSIKQAILEKIKERISKSKVTSVLVKEGLSPDDEKEILSWGIPGVYPNASGLYVNPEELISPGDFARRYTGLYGGSQDDIVHKIRQRDLRYIQIYQKLSLLGSDEIVQYIGDEKKALKQGVISQEESISGFFILSPHAQRIYPERSVGSQIIGFIDNQGEGHYGIEGYFNEMLRGNPGEQVSKKDIRGRTIDPISFGKEDISAQEGVDIYTTIDRNVQKKVEEILERGVKSYAANKGTVVVMQPKTGKILALANYPSYDPNNPGEVYELKKVNYGEYPNPETDLLGKVVFVEDTERGDPYYYDGKEIFLREAKREEYIDYEKTKYLYKNDFGAGVYQNDAVSGLYEPGSIMKAITVAVGIDSGEIQAHEMYNDVGEVTIDNFRISNVDKKCSGYHSFTHALSFSCNVGMIRIVQRVGRAILFKYLEDFGFNKETGISLSGEINSRIEPYEKWPISKLLTSSYGLGISVTPLQMATAYSVIANGGLYMQPYIVERIIFPDGTSTEYEPRALKKVLKPSTSKSVVRMLVRGVSEGVAKNAAVEGYSIAGKTGTSQIAYRGKYEEGVASTYASFAGFAPAEDPQFVIVVKLDRPRTNQYGGQTSAHIFSQLSKELLEYYQIPKSAQK